MAQFAPFNPIREYQTSRANALSLQQAEEELSRAPIRNQLAELQLQKAQQGLDIAGAREGRESRESEIAEMTRRAKILSRVAGQMKKLPLDQRMPMLQSITPELETLGIPASRFPVDQPLDDIYLSQVEAEALSLQDPTTALSAEQKFYNSLIEQGNLTPEQAQEAARVKLRISAPATGSAELTAIQQGMGRDVAGFRALTQGAKTRSEEETKTAQKVISGGFDALSAIDNNLSLYDRAINIIDRGVGTGPIKQFLPTFEANTRQLEQIQRELGLSIIGSVTFGALSEGELNLALSTAFDLGLKPEALRKDIMRRAEAQRKLQRYVTKQIGFLSEPNPDGTNRTVNDWLEYGKTREGKAEFKGEQELFSTVLNKSVTMEEIQQTAKEEGITANDVMRELGIQ